MDLETLRTFIQSELDKRVKEANAHTDKVEKLKEQMNLPCNKGNEWVIEPKIHQEELNEHYALGITTGLIDVLAMIDKEGSD